MKKSVVILIGVIYALSIVIVTLYGLNFGTFNDPKYVTGIEITDSDLKYDESGLKYVSLSPDGNGKRQYQIHWTVTPDDANNKNVTFSYDTSKAYVSVDENGLVSFTEPGVITVTVKAADGTPYYDTIKIIFKR